MPGPFYIFTDGSLCISVFGKNRFNFYKNKFKINGSLLFTPGVGAPYLVLI